VFVEDPKTGAWAPGKESPHPIRAPEGSRFVHVQFSSLGHDLVVLDDVGLAHLFIAPTGLGRMHVGITDFGLDRTGRNSNDAVVGTHWLSVWPSEFKVSIIASGLILRNLLTDVADPIYWVRQESKWLVVYTGQESRPQYSQSTQPRRWQKCAFLRIT